MSTESVVVVLPLPGGLLSPNNKPGSFGGRMQASRAVKSYRAKACAAAEALGVETGPWKRVTVALRFYHRERRGRDDVNYMQMMKPAYDGLVDARLIQDDDSKHLKTLGCDFAIDRKSPRVELTIERIA